jgi:hypothetical protein
MIVGIAAWWFAGSAAARATEDEPQKQEEADDGADDDTGDLAAAEAVVCASAALVDVHGDGGGRCFLADDEGRDVDGGVGEGSKEAVHGRRDAVGGIWSHCKVGRLVGLVVDRGGLGTIENAEQAKLHKQVPHARAWELRG